MIQKIYPLTEDEQAWLDALLAVLEEDLELRGDVEGMNEFFTVARAEWFMADAQERVDPNPTVSVIGAGVGEVLAQRLGLEWGVIEDERGAELGLHGDPGAVVILPLSSLGKLWVQGGSVADFIAAVTERITQVRANL